jgi:rhodanese-related sulfurtransferase
MVTQIVKAPNEHWRKVALHLAGLALLALGLGLAVNAVRTTPLPLRYRDKAARLQAETRTLGTTARAAAEIGYVVPEELAAALQQTPAPAVLDARPTVIYEQGHVPGALSLPRGEFSRAFAQQRTALEADRARPLVVYCQGGACEDSELVAKALLELGFSRVAILVGGWEAWKEFQRE